MNEKPEWLKYLTDVQYSLNGNGGCAVSASCIGEILIRWVENGNVFKMYGGDSFRRALKRDFHCNLLSDGWFLFDKSIWPNVAKWISLAVQKDLKQRELSKATKDLENLENRLNSVSETELRSEVCIRNGQDILRKYLLFKRHSCEVSGVNLPELLVASHILPWKDCGKSVGARLDLENVLLLARNWDALFDKKFISFDPETGKMIKSDRISEEDLIKFGMPKDWRETVKIPVKTERRKKYLTWHLNAMRTKDAS